MNRSRYSRHRGQRLSEALSVCVQHTVGMGACTGQRRTEIPNWCLENFDVEKARLVNQKILFVDDEPAVLDGYKLILQKEFDIATAVSGEEGLVVLRNDGPFAVIISDMQMSGMDGVEFLKRVRQVAQHHTTRPYGPVRSK